MQIGDEGQLVQRQPHDAGIQSLHYYTMPPIPITPGLRNVHQVGRGEHIPPRSRQ